MEACDTLKEYSLFVSIVRQYIKEIPKNVDDRNDAVGNAISKAIDKCIADGTLSIFLKKHRAKVQEASMWDYNEELHLKNVKKEGYDEGYDTGYDNAAIAIFNNLINKGHSKEEAMELTGVTEDMLLNNIKS
jgi:flagellar biosynthesis/type III secretory pathway protein FliH